MERAVFINQKKKEKGRWDERGESEGEQREEWRDQVKASQRSTLRGAMSFTLRSLLPPCSISGRRTSWESGKRRRRRRREGEREEKKKKKEGAIQGGELPSSKLGKSIKFSKGNIEENVLAQVKNESVECEGKELVHMGR